MPAVSQPPGRFFSAAQAASGGWIFVTSDGAVKEVKPGGAAAIFDPPDWGTDVATVRNSCGGMNLLASGAGDYTVADTLRAYEWTSAGPVRSADAVEFSGAITALWTASDGASATVVSKNLKSGRYEAFAVTAVCAR